MNEISFIRSSRGGKLLQHQNYLFHIERRREHLSYWNCAAYPKCRARVVLQNDMFKSSSGFHTHEPAIKEIQRKTFAAKLKERAATEVKVSVPKIYREEVAQAATSDEVASCLPNFRSAEKIMYRARSSRSKTVVEEANDQIPIQPIIQIKEEPSDDYQNPSTSNEEFILPHVDTSWMTPNSILEQQLTLSVTNQGSTNETEASDGEQLRNNQRTNSSDITPLLTAPKDTEVRPKCKEQFYAFGYYVAEKLISLDPISSACAQQAIDNIIIEAERGRYLSQTEDTKPSIVPASI